MVRFGAQVRPLIKIQKDLNLEGEIRKLQKARSIQLRRAADTRSKLYCIGANTFTIAFGNQRKKLSVIDVLNISTRTNKRFINTAFKLARK